MQNPTGKSGSPFSQPAAICGFTRQKHSSACATKQKAAETAAAADRWNFEFARYENHLRKSSPMGGSIARYQHSHFDARPAHQDQRRAGDWIRSRRCAR